jgi:hypothetical protein
MEFEPTPTDCDDPRCQIGPSYRSAIVGIYGRCVIDQIKRTMTIPESVTLRLRTAYAHGEQCPEIVASCDDSNSEAMDVVFAIENEFPQSLDKTGMEMFRRLENSLDSEAMADDVIR